MKYEDLRTVLQMFFPGMFVFSFDLRSAYHHIDTCDKHRKFLSFKWTSSDGVTKFYEIKVLPFGMCSAPYVFTKVLRQLVKYWRGSGHLTLMYLNDGLGGDTSFESTKSLSDCRVDFTHKSYYEQTLIIRIVFTLSICSCALCGQRSIHLG